MEIFKGVRKELEMRWIYSQQASFFRLLAMYSLQRPPKSVVWVALFRQLNLSSTDLVPTLAVPSG
jgi:hypothetical protein